MKLLRKITQKIKDRIEEFRYKRKLKKRMEEIRKRDPFIYD